MENCEVRCEICNSWLPENDIPWTWRVYPGDRPEDDIIAHDECYRARERARGIETFYADNDAERDLKLFANVVARS